MGTFYVRCKVENHVDRSKATVVPKLLVDTGTDYTWIPAKLLEKIGVEQEKKRRAVLDDQWPEHHAKCRLRHHPPG